ncbi:MAG TPA: phosphoribosylformylglycinamidine synthase subunit PurL [Dehalococcoidales bacterium]|nr:phosphoribosylformylglycinamidine synthase subunit PurL [Dehalococcoidales bacterium]
MHRIEIRLKPHLPDPRASGLIKDISDLAIKTATAASVADVYYLDASLKKPQVKTICAKLLADPVTQDFEFDEPVQEARGVHDIEVAYNAGVVDPVEESVMKAIRDLGIDDVKAVKTAKRYIIDGAVTKKQLDEITGKLLVNPIIQHTIPAGHYKFSEPPKYTLKLISFNLLTAKKAELEALRKQFGFNELEFNSIVAHYKKLGRNPSDIELETLAQTWSEHCVHKTFKAKITSDHKIINNLLKNTVAKVTKELDKPWCLSVFVDNAGVIEFDDKWALCFKVETHNHPSAVEPYGGAATGIGGVIRDPLGTGLGAKPIANTDVFCFAPPDFPQEELPPGVLHPRRIFKGVRAGVADYGNRMGIPTLNGALFFDKDYLANPLVFCGTLGLLPKEKSQRGVQRCGDLAVVVGGKTGRDGMHGVTFASEQLTDESGEKSFTSVQIGNPIVEKKMLDVILEARDKGLFCRITDVGGGGLSSAFGEMGQDTGIRVDLEKVPLKYAGLSYTEIWISESQERQALAVPPEHIKQFLALCKSEDVEAAVIGEFTNDKHLRLMYKGKEVGDLEMDFLHEGRPQWQMQAVWQPAKYAEPRFAAPADLGKSLKSILGTWNVCSKEWVIRQYDHEVQGGSVLKPLVGAANDGPGDASVIRPVPGSDKGAIIANGMNPHYGKIDAYWMAASAIDEVLRQIVAVGGNLDEVALLDNFCWGDTRRPDMLGTLIRAAQACYDMGIVYGTPFVSGKDSLYNEFEYKGKLISIPHSLLISAMGVIDNVNKIISMDLKQAGNSIYIVGATANELGGSAYLLTRKLVGNSVPKVNPATAKKTMDALSSATSQGLVRSCHDCSEGGVGVAVAEMAFAGGLGARINLKAIPMADKITRDDTILFAESNSRFICEVTPENKAAFEKALKGVVFAEIGAVIKSPVFEVNGLNGKKVLSEKITELKEAWQKPLRW